MNPKLRKLIEDIINGSELRVTANLRYQESELDDVQQANKIEKEVDDLASAIETFIRDEVLDEKRILNIILKLKFPRLGGWDMYARGDCEILAKAIVKELGGEQCE